MVVFLLRLGLVGGVFWWLLSLFLVVVLILLCVVALVLGWFPVSVFPMWISSLWMFCRRGVVVICWCLILVWFWCRWLLPLCGGFSGVGFCFGFGFWISADGLCYYDLSEFVLGCGFLVVGLGCRLLFCFELGVGYFVFVGVVIV